MEIFDTEKKATPEIIKLLSNAGMKVYLPAEITCIPHPRKKIDMIVYDYKNLNLREKINNLPIGLEIEPSHPHSRITDSAVNQVHESYQKHLWRTPRDKQTLLHYAITTPAALIDGSMYRSRDKGAEFSKIVSSVDYRWCNRLGISVLNIENGCLILYFKNWKYRLDGFYSAPIMSWDD